mgnify:CR=1 FL=1
MKIQPIYVSVIIPTYNRKHCVGQAIESVLNQTYRNYELIVIDDASTDGTPEWVKNTYLGVERCCPLQLVCLPSNRGAAAARNEGIRVAQGELIAFLDSDDRWEPEFLEMQVKTLQENTDAILTYCNYTEIQKNGTQFKHNLKPWKIYPDFTHHLLMENVIHSMSLVIIRREALMQTGLLNESLKICHDRELYLRLLRIGKIVHTPQELVIKIMHEDNLVGNYRCWAKEILMVIDIFFADESNLTYKRLEREARSYATRKLAKLVWQCEQDVLFTMEMFFKSVYFYPPVIYRGLLKRWQAIIYKIKVNP